MFVLLPPLPLTICTAGVGRPEVDGLGWAITRIDYYLCGPSGLRGPKIRVWSRPGPAAAGR